MKPSMISAGSQGSAPRPSWELLRRYLHSLGERLLLQLQAESLSRERDALHHERDALAYERDTIARVGAEAEDQRLRLERGNWLK